MLLANLIYSQPTDMKLMQCGMLRVKMIAWHICFTGEAELCVLNP